MGNFNLDKQTWETLFCDCLKLANSAQPNRGSKARGAEPFTWFREHADMTHEQPGPSRTTQACIPFYRGEIGIPTFTGRDTEKLKHISKRQIRTRSTCGPCSSYRLAKCSEERCAGTPAQT